MEYTKGEWRVGNPCHASTYTERTSIFAPFNKGTGDAIVKIATTDTTYCLLSDEECEANAQLMAAAPAMYEALKAMEEIFEALYRVGQPQYGVIPFYTERHQKVKSALAKAEGK